MLISNFHIYTLYRQHYPNYKMVYLDLFAGNGLNKIEYERRKYFVCGSSLPSLLSAYSLTQTRQYSCYFDHMILIDNNPRSNGLLADRSISLK